MKALQKSKRIHSMDSLRGIMMLLGLVIHSAITYGVVDYGNSWSLKDGVSTHLSNDFIVSFIHAFRMQAFFFVAGFFGAMLFYERKPMKMIKNRVSRIVFPFIVFLILLWPTILFSFAYTEAVIAGSETAFSDTIAYFSDPRAFIPQRTFHLWFLYYLAMITFVTVAIALVLNNFSRITSQINRVFNAIFKHPLLRLLVFTSVTALGYVAMDTYSVATSTSFVPDIDTFIYYFIFYGIGWIFYSSKEHLDSFMRYDWLSVFVATLLFCVYFFMEDTLPYASILILKSVMVWLFIFGISGVFIRYWSNHSAVMRYLSDSSYWVYLVHLSFTAYLPSFIADWAIPATFKFLIILTTTGIICFVSYHFFVRGSFIGKFLNGRTYSKKLSDIRKAEAQSKLKPAISR